MKSGWMVYWMCMFALWASLRNVSNMYIRPLLVEASLNTFQKGGNWSPSMSPDQLYRLVSLMPIMVGALSEMVLSRVWQGVGCAIVLVLLAEGSGDGMGDDVRQVLVVVVLICPAQWSTVIILDFDGLLCVLLSLCWCG